MVYFHFYESVQNFDMEYYGDAYKEPWISLTTENHDVNYNKAGVYDGNPLTFVITSNGYINWSTGDASFAKTIEYSKDSGITWTEITSTESGTRIDVSSGETVMFRGDNPTYSSETEGKYNNFGRSTCGFIVKGNIMSMINSTNFADLKVLSENWTFSGLFYECTGLTDASELLLPATSITDYCYNAMFHDCSNLTVAPELPAMILKRSCYESMFVRNKLIKAPNLPATTLAPYCYKYMFYGNSSMTVDEGYTLPAKQLFEDSYRCMFEYCRSVNYMKCLATDITPSACTYYFLKDTASSGTFVKDRNTYWPSGYENGIPSGWTTRDADD